MACVTLVAWPLYLQALVGAPAPSAAPGDVATPPPVAQVQVSRDDLEKPVRGLYLSLRPLLGTALIDAKVSGAGPAYPGLDGQSECLGLTSGVDLALGYDVAANVGVHVAVGALAAVGCRTDRVRGLGAAYAGFGARFRLALRDRLAVAIVPQALVARLDNGVEAAKFGGMAGISLGLDYDVHVRHFALGVEVALMAPLSPTRIFVGLQPHLRYTF